MIRIVMNLIDYYKNKKVTRDDKEVRFDLKSNHEECPICQSKLNHYSDRRHDYYEGYYDVEYWSCNNKCYYKKKESCTRYYDIHIFEDYYDLFPYDKEQEDIIWEKIYYWTENERYVMKLLEDK